MPVTHTPSPFAKGRTVTLRLPDGRNKVDFIVEKAFEPFTKSVALLARFKTAPAGAPTRVVLKIFDPRYFDERLPDRYFSGVEWSLESEQGAVMRPEPVQRNASGAGTPQELRELNELVDRPNPSPKDVARRLERYEVYYQQAFTSAFVTELTAYNQLRDLQGVVIPRLLLHGHYMPPDRRYFIPPMLVVEFIDGISVKDAPASALTPAIITQLRRDVARFASYGVLHSDLHSSNVLLEPAHAPQHARFIDFAGADIRGSRPDEEWNEDVACANEPGFVRALLGEKRIPWQPEFGIPRYRT